MQGKGGGALGPAAGGTHTCGAVEVEERAGGDVHELLALAVEVERDLLGLRARGTASICMALTPKQTRRSPVTLRRAEAATVPGSSVKAQAGGRAPRHTSAEFGGIMRHARTGVRGRQ